MSNTQNITTHLDDEALDAAPAQEAFSCAICGPYPCMISDEALDPAPVQEALVCTVSVACAWGGISDTEGATR